MKHVFNIMLLGLVLTTASCQDKTNDKADTTDQPKVEKEDHILETDSLDNPTPNPENDIVPADSAAVDSL